MEPFFGKKIFMMKNFLILSLVMKSIKSLDIAVLNTINQLQPFIGQHLLLFASFIGRGTVVVTLVIPFLSFLVYMYSKNYKYACIIITFEMYVTTLFNSIIIQLIKHTVRTDRPISSCYSGHLKKILYTEPELYGFSFPSGHSSMFLTPFLTWKNGMDLLLRPTHKTHSIHAWNFLFTSISIFVALSRIVTASHWPSDVLFSIALTLFTYNISRRILAS